MTDRRPRAWNSTLPMRREPLRSKSGLQRSTPLRSRSLRERATDDTYGPVWEAAKTLPCWGLRHVPGHVCELGHTAHHEPPVSRGGDDYTGLVATCEKLHGILDRRALGETRSELLARIGWTEDDLQEWARETSARALEMVEAGS